MVSFSSQTSCHNFGHIFAILDSHVKTPVSKCAKCSVYMVIKVALEHFSRMNNPKTFSLSTELFYVSNNFCGPPVDLVQQICVPPVLEPDAVLQLAFFLNEEAAQVILGEAKSLKDDGARGFQCPELEDHDYQNDQVPADLEAVWDLLLQLELYKAMVPDGINPRNILKELADVIAKPLLIFEQSRESGEVPTDWKLLNIVLIFNKSEKEDPWNCRPVSHSSVPGKVMEKIILGGLEGIWSKFTDHTKLAGAVDSLHGREALQRDLGKSETRAITNHMTWESAGFCAWDGTTLDV
ncbi:hypothetical protein TURU_071661 [Turdus rufiventris]|nr:hypothetical protein TURU_071661 [Turdus rufiventris]